MMCLMSGKEAAVLGGPEFRLGPQRKASALKRTRPFIIPCM